MADHIPPRSNAENPPVTISVYRRILPGREAAYEEWIRGISEVASHFDGQQGINILRPSEQTGGRYVVIYRFDTYEHATAWENSPVRTEWIAKLEGITDGEPDRESATGLEVWFDLPEAPRPTQPPRHKMAVVLIAVIFALVFALQLLLGPVMTGLPRWSQTLIIVTIQVLAMTYLIMPVITMLLKAWLFRKKG
ncbi:antibiotic biosynthesis monooxygenase [Shimia sp.]|uniref:antibiotic biosynthesis monooxygenase n=1 Tax=Shimia sp. TaxID=1954381 RepID=UPI003BAD066E